MTTDLRDGVRGSSQTDLLAILKVARELTLVAVEGKAEESFGPLVSEWLTADPNRRRRFDRLASLFGVTVSDAFRLRYQLFHRTAAAIYEAERYCANTAMMLVHSFSPKASGWTDFAAFVEAIGLGGSSYAPGVFGPKEIEGIELYAAWVSDELQASPGS